MASAGLVASIAALAQAATPPPLRAAHAAVASDNPLASAAGLAAAEGRRQRRRRRLRDGAGAGGRAPRRVRASAAADSRWSIWPRRRRRFALDFRERAPAGITPAAYFKDGKVEPELSKRGGLAVAVPGEVRGLGEMVKRWGKLPFSRCVDGAQQLAARGFPVSWRLARNLATSIARRRPATRAFMQMFAGKPLAEGDTLRRPDLAWTLGGCAPGGADAFYKGRSRRRSSRR